MSNKLSVEQEVLSALEGLLLNAPEPRGVKKDFHYLVHREAAKRAIERAKASQTQKQSLTQETPEQAVMREYIETPNFCPHCKSESIKAEKVSGDERSAWSVVKCDMCEQVWQEVFTLAFIEELDGSPFKLNPPPPKDEDKYPLCDWKHEVANGDTKLGYAEWVQHRKEAEEGKEAR